MAVETKEVKKVESKKEEVKKMSDAQHDILLQLLDLDGVSVFGKGVETLHELKTVLRARGEMDKEQKDFVGSYIHNAALPIPVKMVDSVVPLKKLFPKSEENSNGVK